MVAYWPAILAGALAGAGVAIVLARWLLAYRAQRQLAQARRSFPLRREWLEARFFDLASRSGKPRGLAWVGCDFESDVVFARERDSRLLRALVGVTIQFEAVEGGGMEEVEAVGNLRAATAVFHYDGRQWNTDGRAIFNLSPAQAMAHFCLEPVNAERR